MSANDTEKTLHAAIKPKVEELMSTDGTYVTFRNIFITSLASRELPLVVATRFLQLGEEGYDLLKSGVGEGLADFCDERNCITLVIFFGYTILALCTLHSCKVLYDPLLT